MKSLSFFTGAGGLDLGMRSAGIQNVLTSEIDVDARKTILNNFGKHQTLIGDIADYSTDEILSSAMIDRGNVDIIMGGVPCQSFSTMGKRGSLSDPRGNLLVTFLDRCMDIRPKYIVIENVRGFMTIDSGEVMDYTLNRLKQNNYIVSFNLYDAAFFGVAQHRERLIIIAVRRDVSINGQPVNFLTATNSNNSVYMPPLRRFYDVTSDIYEHRHEFLKPSDRLLEYMSLLKPGQNWRYLPEDMKREAMGGAYRNGGGNTGFYRRLAWDKPSPTLMTNPLFKSTLLFHPEKPRPLSIQEYKRLQGFPDDFRVHGDLQSKYKQIGNAVPVVLGFAIGATLIGHYDRTDEKPHPDFRYSRYKNTSHETWVSKKNTLNQII